MKALNARKSAQATKLIPPNDPNEINDPKLRTASNNSSFTPTNKGMRALAKPDMNQVRQAAWNDIALTAAHDGWSKHEIAAQKTFYNPSEMIALGSLKFNIEPNAKFTKTADAIVARNRPGAAYEIKIHTNNKGRETNKTVWVSPSAG